MMLSVLGALLAGGCSSSRVAPVAVSSREAIEIISKGGDVRVVDTRTVEDMEKERIAGSRWFDTSGWYARVREPATSFDHPESWKGEFEKLAIGPGTRVLIVDAGNPERPGRGAGVWYLMQRLGFANASFVSGGYMAIVREERLAGRESRLLVSGPVAPGEQKGLPGPVFTPTGRAVFGGTSGKEDVRWSLAAREVRLVDARSVEEYTGQEIFEGNPRGGHIPGSVLVTHRDVFGSDAGFRSREEIRARLEAAGLRPGDEIITYCQGGGRSAALAAAMIYAGYEDVDNYFGSFGEWSKDESCPVDVEPAVEMREAVKP